VTSTGSGGADAGAQGPLGSLCLWNAGCQALVLRRPLARQYFYAVGDIVFVVSGDPFELVEAAFTLLP
jgi:hypothetical protein